MAATGIVSYLTPESNEDVSFSGTTAPNTADFSTRYVMLTATADCRILFGEAGVEATLTDVPLVGGVPYIFDRGTNKRIAVISSSTGTLSITSMS